MMHAIVRSQYGTPEVLTLRTVPRPAPAADEVLVQVHGSSVNFGDWVMLTGRPYLARLMTGLFRPKRAGFGLDVAGVVQAVGADVVAVKPGDAVFGEAADTHAEWVCVPEGRLALKPAGVTFEQAATLPVAGVTALQGLRDRAGVQPGQRVLVNGASGGVGSFAVQIAKALGAEVTAVCSGRNAAWVRALGADTVVDYSEADFTQTSVRYDVIFDLVGSASVAACRRILQPSGVYISSVGRLGRVLKALAASVLPGPKVALFAAMPSPADLAALAALVESGSVTPAIDQRYRLDEVPEALRRQGAGHAQGKSVISMRASSAEVA
jgi:NADPH:quinone reductase-like Zn-dependent oxidoreductase